jgi:hypothetical protein
VAAAEALATERVAVEVGRPACHRLTDALRLTRGLGWPAPSASTRGRSAAALGDATSAAVGLAADAGTTRRRTREQGHDAASCRHGPADDVWEVRLADVVRGRRGAARGGARARARCGRRSRGDRRRGRRTGTLGAEVLGVPVRSSSGPETGGRPRRAR